MLIIVNKDSKACKSSCLFLDICCYYRKMKLNAEKDEESVNNDNENSTEDTSEKRNKNSKATVSLYIIILFKCI